MNEHRSHRTYDTRHVALLVGGLLVIALLAVSRMGSESAFMSPEVKFTDSSKGGLAIVPASCPSNPHFGGDCSGSPQPPGNNCSITALNDVLAPGQSTTLSWTTANYQWFVVSLSPYRGNINPLGTVDPTGSSLIAPTRTTTYTLTGRYSVGDIREGIPLNLLSYACSHTVYVLNCPAGYTVQNGQCVISACPAGQQLREAGGGGGAQCVSTGSGGVGACTAQRICQGNYSVYQAANCAISQSQLCAYGCSAGACVVPAPSIVTWNVRPILVQSGTAVRVTWAAENVQSCTVRGTNGDGSGSNATGLWDDSSGDKTTTPITAQTVYTILCQGFAGSSPSSVSRSTTVNIVPIFNEP